MKRIFFTLITGFLVSAALAQNSILEDSEGEGSFKVYSSTISVNTGESAIKATILIPTSSSAPVYGVDFYAPGDRINRYRIIIDDITFVLPSGTTAITVSGDTLNPGNAVRRILYQSNFANDMGFTINGIASDGTSNLFSEGKLNPKGEIGFFKTFYGTNDNLSSWDYITFSAGVSAKDVTLVDTGGLFNDPTNQTSIGFNAELNYNSVGSIGSSTSIFGIGLSYVIRDNSNLLSAIKYDVTNTLATSGTIVATRQSSVEGFDVSNYESNINTLNINADYGFYPSMFNDRLLIAGQLRGKVVENVDTTWNFGLGFYLADENVSTKIIGGINVIASDLTEAISTDPLKERITINLVAGFKI